MTTTAIIFSAIIIVLLGYVILIYNNLIIVKNNVLKNWSNIDVLLKQRYSEIPKLVEACKQYMQYEQETLTKVVQARQAAMSAQQSQDILALGQAENQLKSGLLKLFALAENYPNLKTDQSFVHLQGRISELETAISDRREFYNDSVNVYNIRIQQFPDLIIANMFNFKQFDLLKFGESELQDVSVKGLFKG